MLRKIFKLICVGISWGCTISCLISMAGYTMMGNEWFLSSPRGFNAQVAAAMIVGMGWSLPTVVYDNEKLSKVQQLLIHAAIGFIVYIPIAFYMQWIPLGNISLMLASILIAIVSAFIVWLCFYFYYKWEAREINREIKEKDL